MTLLENCSNASIYINAYTLNSRLPLSLQLPLSLCSGNCRLNHPHLTDKEAETYRGKVSSRLQNWEVVEKRLFLCCYLKYCFYVSKFL